MQPEVEATRCLRDTPRRWNTAVAFTACRRRVTLRRVEPLDEAFRVSAHPVMAANAIARSYRAQLSGRTVGNAALMAPRADGDDSAHCWKGSQIKNSWFDSTATESTFIVAIRR